MITDDRVKGVNHVQARARLGLATPSLLGWRLGLGLAASVVWTLLGLRISRLRMSVFCAGGIRAVRAALNELLPRAILVLLPLGNHQVLDSTN